MRTLLVFVILFGLCPAELLEAEVSGPDADAAGIVSVRPSPLPASPATESSLPLMPGWPVTVGSGWYSPSRGVAFADLDGNGKQEVILPSGDGLVYAWRHDGTNFPGWPVNLATDSCQYAAAVADIDLDGELDIAVGTRSFVSGDGPVYLFEKDGQVKSGWPFRGGGGYFNESPTLADVDGDDTLEVIVSERRYPLGYLYVLRHDGRIQPGSWPEILDHVPATGAAVGDIDGDGEAEIVQASYNSLYVFAPDGTLRAGWPVTMPDGRNWSYQSPVLADIDGDDTLEIITAMHKDGGGCYVFRHDGTLQPGWPVAFTRWTYCPPTVCDLYRDGSLEILCGVSAGVSGYADVLHACDPSGAALPGFPYVSQTGSNEPNITVADIDGDGDMEILVTSNLITSADSLGYIHALHHDGSPVSGFPLRPWGFTYLNGPNVADVNGDGLLDIVAVSAYAGITHVTIWEAGVPFSRMSWEWPTYQFDMARTGVYRPALTGVAETGPNPRPALRATPSVARPGATIRLTGFRGTDRELRLFDAAGRTAARLPLAPDRSSVRLPGDLSRGVYLLGPGVRVVVTD